MRYGLEADVNGLNPTASALSSPGLMMANAVFDTLTATTADNQVVPFLAQSVEPATDDFKSWTLTLRPDILFTDGTPLNADAIVTNFEAQRNHPLVGLAVKPFFPETNAAQKIDDMTVQFNLLDSNAYFPATLATQLGMVASPTWLAAALADPTLNQEPVGTGPFKFDSRSQDSVTRFVRNDDWWNGDVYLDAVEFYPVPDTAHPRRPDAGRRARSPADHRPRRHHHAPGRGDPQRLRRFGGRTVRDDQHRGGRRSTTSAPARRWRGPPRGRPTST